MRFNVWCSTSVSRPQTPVAIATADLYPDALDCVASARSAGFSVGIAGNQPADVEAVLRGVGFDADFIASSAAWGVAKPAREFFERVIAEAHVEAPKILYVGTAWTPTCCPPESLGCGLLSSAGDHVAISVLSDPRPPSPIFGSNPSRNSPTSSKPIETRGRPRRLAGPDCNCHAFRRSRSAATASWDSNATIRHTEPTGNPDYEQ